MAWLTCTTWTLMPLKGWLMSKNLFCSPMFPIVPRHREQRRAFIYAVVPHVPHVPPEIKGGEV